MDEPMSAPVSETTAPTSDKASATEVIAACEALGPSLKDAYERGRDDGLLEAVRVLEKALEDRAHAVLGTGKDQREREHDGHAKERIGQSRQTLQIVSMLEEGSRQWRRSC